MSCITLAGTHAVPPFVLMRPTHTSRGAIWLYRDCAHPGFIFLTLSGSPTKFSKAGFLLRSIGSILQQRTIEFRVIHALDLPPIEPAADRIADQFIVDTVEQVQQAAAIALVTPATKESSPALLRSLLKLCRIMHSQKNLSYSLRQEDCPARLRY